MEEAKRILEHIPNTPPEGVIPWLRKKHFFDKQYITYRHCREYNSLTGKNERAVRCHCSECERDFTMAYVPVEVCCSRAYVPVRFGFFNEATMENVFSGKDTKCPVCGASVRAIHISDISKCGKLVRSVYPMTVHKICGRAVLLKWRIRYMLDKKGRTYIECFPHEGGIVLDRKIVRICGFYDYGLGCISFSDEWDIRKRYIDCIRQIPGEQIYPFGEKALDGTSLENSKLYEYIKGAGKTGEVFPLSYAYLYLKHKSVENLITSGMSRYVNDELRFSCREYGAAPSVSDIRSINWKECKPHLMLGLTKEELRAAKADKWGSADIDFYRKAKCHGVTPGDMAECRKEGLIQTEYLFAFDVPIMKTLRYLKKQRKKFKTNLPNCVYICDYWNMARTNGKNIADEAVCYPHNLVNAHNAEDILCKKEKNRALDIKFKKRLQELEKYRFTYEGLSIHPAKSSAEMISEGAKLCHCVGTYVNSHATGRTTIFFIRRANHPRTPYFTLEYNIQTGEVLQNRGFKNCARTPEVKEFEQKWLDFIDETIKKKKRKAA